jgi:hypothetical protein
VGIVFGGVLCSSHHGDEVERSELDPGGDGKYPGQGRGTDRVEFERAVRPQAFSYRFECVGQFEALGVLSDLDAVFVERSRSEDRPTKKHGVLVGFGEEFGAEVRPSFEDVGVFCIIFFCNLLCDVYCRCEFNKYTIQYVMKLGDMVAKKTKMLNKMDVESDSEDDPSESENDIYMESD